MKNPFPPLRADKILPISHFPAPFQCVIFRCWGMIDAARIGEVICTDENTVRRSAAQMGLDPDVTADPDWLVKGYITIIRSLWHVLDYDGLCTLLGWDHSKLAFVLREDDFLEVKLGNFKPAVSDYHYRPLTDDELRRTDEIAAAVKKYSGELPPVTAKPFDFAPLFRARNGFAVPETAKIKKRFCYSYCALFGDTFLDRELIDSSFPDELLEAYRAVGITGVWTHIVLYKMVKFPFAPQISEGYEKRQEGMKYLTEKLAKYGLELFVYFNEPRSMPMSFFEEHPDLLGYESNGYGTLCLSSPSVRDYLRNGCAELVKNVPLLGGFFTITASENLTNCRSHDPYGGKCPRCAGKTAPEIYADVNRLILEGARSVSDTVRIIAWTWGWPREMMPDVVKLLPDGIDVMTVSEQAVSKMIGSTRTEVLDYSISVEGPGEYALSTWRHAHNRGLDAFAKMQINNSWELGSIPYIPAFEKPYRHLSRIIKSGSCPEGLMLSWSLGGYPSPMFEIFARMYSGTVPTLRDLYEELFPEADCEKLGEAIHLFSEAFDEYPFHIGCAYSGPQLTAPANLLYSEPSGFSATMTCFPFDDIEKWRGIFPLDTYVTQLKKMSHGWDEGLKLLREALSGRALSQKTAELSDCAEACGCHFRSMYLQCAYVILRDGMDYDTRLTVREILEREKESVMETARLISHNPSIGYESSNHYLYTQNALLEKLVNIDYVSGILNK